MTGLSAYFLITSLVLGSTTETMDTSALSIEWKTETQLPAPEGYTESLGVAGAFVATLGDFLVVAGGTNFPKGHPFFDKAQKHYYPDVFIYHIEENGLRLVEHHLLPEGIAYGATVVANSAMYLVGGETTNTALNSVLKITLGTDGTMHCSTVAILPFTWAYGGAAIAEEQLYLFGGRVDDQGSNSVFRLPLHQALATKPEVVSQIPGAIQRQDFPHIQIGKQFYLFGGVDPSGFESGFVLNDTLIFDLATMQWDSGAPIQLEKQPFSVAGGAAVQLNEHQVLLLGGVNYQVFNDAMTQLSSLQGEDLLAFKQGYFSKSIEEVGFSRKQLIFGLQSLGWQWLNRDVPFPGGAGPLHLSTHKDLIFWVSGEVKPGVRTPYIYSGSVK